MGEWITAPAGAYRDALEHIGFGQRALATAPGNCFTAERRKIPGEERIQIAVRRVDRSRAPDDWQREQTTAEPLHRKATSMLVLSALR